MALSGSNYVAVGKYWRVVIEWSATQSVSGNYSNVTAKLYWQDTGTQTGVKSSASKSGSITIDGTNYNFSGSGLAGLNKSQKKLIHTATKRVNHNSDGTKSISVSGSFSMAVTLSGTYYGSRSVSTTAHLNTIARASTPSLSTSSQNIGSAITVNTNRKSTSFTHTVKYSFQGTSGTIATGVGASTSWTLPASLANRIPNSTSGTGTITVETFNGSTSIGTKSIGFTAKVPDTASYKPSASAITTSIEGHARSKTLGVYVQTQSRVKASFTATVRGGATTSSTSIQVGSKTYNGTSITSDYLNTSGTMTLTATVRDSRGRTATSTKTISVLPYSAPKITNMNPYRDSANDTIIKVLRAGNIAPVNVSGVQKNTMKIDIHTRESGSTTWVLGKSGSWASSSSTDSTDQLSGTFSASSSFDVRVVIYDDFTTLDTGATQVMTISTAQVPMSLSKTGVGIGKIHERGALDVGGVAYFEEMGYNTIPGGSNLNDYTTPGFYSNGANATVATMTNTPNSQAFGMIVIKNAGVTQMWFQYNTRNVYIRSMYNNNWGSWGLLGGSTAWADITGKPSTFAPSSHNHSGANITSGTVPYARLPVGTGSSQVARGNHTHSYLPTSGGTVSGNLLVTGQGRMGNGKLNVENKGSYNMHIDNSAGQYGEVTMRPSAHNHGNLGSLKYTFDSSSIKTMTNGSNRETKTDIKPYDESVAYEELRYIPIYTFKYKEGQYENYHLGSMMDYMPLDIIDTGTTADGDKPNAWTHDSTIWFNMAVSKELQKKVENLEEKNLELEIKLNELEEKLQWL